MKSEKILLTISLLVSNRIDTIRKCMESIKPLLDSVPSELIAVDTVGEENSDGSLAVVKEYTDHIVHFDWCNDFAAARNAGLKEAKGEWFLFLDDDEWFENVTPIILFFLEGEYKEFDRAWYIARNYKDTSGESYVEAAVDRMCRIVPGLHFEGKIHEHLMPVLPRVMQFFCYVHHYGYAFKSEEERVRHFERNYRLLKEDFEKNPKDARSAIQLSNECLTVGRLDEALDCAKKTLELNQDNILDPFVQYLLLTLISIEMAKQNWELAKKQLEEIEKNYPLNEVSKLVCAAWGLNIESNCENISLAVERVRQYYDMRRKIDELGEKVLQQDASDRKWYRSKECEEKIFLLGVPAAIKTEAYDVLQMLFERVDWDSRENKPFEQMVLLVEAYTKSGNGNIFFPYAEKILDNPEMEQPFRILLEGLWREDFAFQSEIQNWMQRYNAKKQEKAIQEEINRLAEELKRNINDLILLGKIPEAKALYKSLKELLPQHEGLEKLNSILEVTNYK